MKLQTPKMVKVYVHISPDVSCWVTNLFIYVYMYKHFEFLLLYLQLLSAHIDKTITTDTPKSHEVCVLYIFR